MTDALQTAAQVLAELSDQEWLELKRTEDRRRAEQRVIRDLAQELRERKAEAAR